MRPVVFSIKKTGHDMRSPTFWGESEIFILARVFFWRWGGVRCGGLVILEENFKLHKPSIKINITIRNVTQK